MPPRHKIALVKMGMGGRKASRAETAVADANAMPTALTALTGTDGDCSYDDTGLDSKDVVSAIPNSNVASFSGLLGDCDSRSPDRGSEALPGGGPGSG